MDIFFEVPEEANVRIVREAIRRMYRLPVFKGDTDDYWTYSSIRALWWPILEIICVHDREYIWIKPRITLNSQSLNWEAKCWLTIINSRLFPSSNTIDVNLLRAASIYCFMAHRDFDVAKLLHDEMFIISLELLKGFYFPSLITRLCRLARVPEDLRIDGKLALKTPFLARKIKIGMESVGNVDESDDDDNDAEAAAVPPPPRVEEAGLSQPVKAPT